MNIKQIAVAVSLIATAWSAMAVEATQWNPPAGQQSRAEVKADLARAVANGEIAQGETYGAFDYAHQVPSNGNSPASISLITRRPSARTAASSWTQ